MEAKRVKPFHRIHRSCPVPASGLEGSRVTVMFGPFRAREVLHDQWTQPRTWQRPGPWEDFTCLKMKSTSMRPRGAAHQPPTHEESSDGSTHSYELVTAEHFCFDRKALGCALIWGWAKVLQILPLAKGGV